MIEIKDLLLRFQNLLLGEEVKKEAVRATISKYINFEIKPEEIKIKNGIIYLDLKPIFKNEIFLKKDQIFSELNKSLGKKAPDSIR
jgi:hypothetical protein